MAIADAVRQLREARGFTPSGLAKRTRLSPTYIHRVEGGEIVAPRPDTMRRFAETFEVPVRELYRAANLENLLPEDDAEPTSSLAKILAQVAANAPVRMCVEGACASQPTEELRERFEQEGAAACAAVLTAMAKVASAANRQD